MEKEYSSLRMFKDINRFLKPYSAKFALGSVFRLIADLAWLYPAYALATIINFLTNYHAGESLTPIWLAGAFAVLALIARAGGVYIAKRIMYAISERVSIDAQQASIAHMFELDIAWHEKENTGNRLKKIVRGAESIDRVLRMWTNNFIEIAVNFVGVGVVIAHIDKTITILTIIFIVTYYLIAYAFRKNGSRAAIEVNLQEEEMQGTMFEALNNIRTVKVLGMFPTVLRLIYDSASKMYEKVLQRMFWFQTGSSTRALYSNLFLYGSAAFIIYGILHGQYQVGFLVLFWGYFGNILESTSELADITQDYVVARLSIGRMFEVLNEPVQIDAIEGKVQFPTTWQKITFKNVSFGYGENQVLNDVSFEIKRGERVGIVGLSGAGKSTIFKLLLKEYESYTGEILIDDTPLRQINKKDYFRYSAVVLQDTEVFNLSLKDNIVLANNTAQDDVQLLNKAVHVAHVTDFVERLPQGLDTLIGEKGIRLSGGERQRVGIARAVFKNPQLLLLDEATSHLDIESEEKIRLSLHEFFQSVTAIVIAHRLTTIKEMDRIVVIENGSVVESGSFTTLQRKKGRFHELWSKQSL